MEALCLHRDRQCLSDFMNGSDNRHNKGEDVAGQYIFSAAVIIIYHQH